MPDQYQLGDRVGPARLPDGTYRVGTVIAIEQDSGDTMYRVRFDSRYYTAVSECVNGVNPASQFCQWYEAFEINHFNQEN